MRTFSVKVNGVSYEVEIEETGAVISAQTAPAVPATAPASAPTTKPSGDKGSTKVCAPMPGKIVRINAKVGQIVKRGEVLCILEAMKMENEIFAPCDGTVATVEAEAGATVTGETLLFTLN